MVNLFSIYEIRKALKEEFYNDIDDNFRREVTHNITFNTKFIYLKEENIEPEIDKFKGIFSKIINGSRDPKEIETHNKIKGLELKTLKDTFYYQVEEYLIMQWKEFEREYGTDKYIDTNAEMRAFNTKDQMIEFSKSINKFYTDINSIVSFNLENNYKWLTESKKEITIDEPKVDLFIKNNQSNETIFFEYKNIIFSTIYSFFKL